MMKAYLTYYPFINFPDNPIKKEYNVKSLSHGKKLFKSLLCKIKRDLRFKKSPTRLIFEIKTYRLSLFYCETVYTPYIHQTTNEIISYWSRWVDCVYTTPYKTEIKLKKKDTTDNCYNFFHEK